MHYIFKRGLIRIENTTFCILRHEEAAFVQRTGLTLSRDQITHPAVMGVVIHFVLRGKRRRADKPGLLVDYGLQVLRQQWPFE